MSSQNQSLDAIRSNTQTQENSNSNRADALHPRPPRQRLSPSERSDQFVRQVYAQHSVQRPIMTQMHQQFPNLNQSNSLPQSQALTSTIASESTTPLQQTSRSPIVMESIIRINASSQTNQSVLGDTANQQHLLSKQQQQQQSSSNVWPQPHSSMSTHNNNHKWSHHERFMLPSLATSPLQLQQTLRQHTGHDD
jgi:hypothetical protein